VARAVVLLPSLLAAQAGGRNRFEVEATSAGAALRALPVRDLLFDEHGALRPLVNIYVDGVDLRDRGGLGAPLEGGETLRVVAAIAGGDRPRPGVTLQVEGVRHSFDGTPVLAPISLEVETGEFVSIVGPSGCGKSTLFNIVSGLLRPIAGRVLIGGREVTGQTGQVGYMLQKDLLLSWRTVTNNIVLGASLHGRVSHRDRDEARDLAAHYGLGDFLDHYPHALSGGMRQRVALMRTLAFHRDVMLLDEPFGALDSQTRMQMQQLLLRVWNDLGHTILFVTHDVDEAILLSDRVVVMSPRPGRIREIFRIELPRPRVVDLLTAPEFVERKREILGLVYSQGELEAVPA
jgi:ABC-type nitrate/sulfonate/bicarbonate transport system ATPase subunit